MVRPEIESLSGRWKADGTTERRLLSANFWEGELSPADGTAGARVLVVVEE